MLLDDVLLVVDVRHTLQWERGTDVVWSVAEKQSKFVKLAAEVLLNR